jgi:adenosine deaminase
MMSKGLLPEEGKIQKGLEAWPKAELHIHLEGSMRAETMFTLAQRRGVSLPAEDLDGLRRSLITGGYDEFVEIWDYIRPLLRAPEDLAFITRCMLEDAAAQNVLYQEFRFGPVIPIHGGLDIWDGLSAISEAQKEARERLGIRSGLVMGAPRHYPECVEETIPIAVEAFSRGLIVGMDLTGQEEGFPANRYGRELAPVREAGVPLTIHAGEWCGPESVWAAFEVGATRIGHGTRAEEDPRLMRELRDRGTVLEMCPTSNAVTGSVATLSDHPIRRYFEYGLRVTVNSDDPPLFGITIASEYGLLDSTFGFAPEEIARVTLNAVEGAFLPEAEKALLRDDVREGYRRSGVDVDRISGP